MSKLKELEKRLREEPDNLGLRVMVAGALHDAGRRDDAVELYRSVAVAYRDQGRPQQAITVCRSILELAPNDGACKALLESLLVSQPPSQPSGDSPRASTPSGRPTPQGRLSPLPARLTPMPLRPSPPPSVPRPSPLPLPRPSLAPASQEPIGEPARRSSGDVTPLPQPLPYHEADPTSSSQPKLSRSDLPQTLRDELAAYPEIAGIANAARQISASLIAASRQTDADAEIENALAGLTPTLATPPPRLAKAGDVDDDDPTLPPRSDPVPRARATEDETTEPRELPARSRAASDAATLPAPSRLRPSPGAPTAAADSAPALPSPPPRGDPPRARTSSSVPPLVGPARSRPPSIAPPSGAPPSGAIGPLTSAFFAPVPPHNRTAVLQRFRRRMAASGMTVIRRGESGHGLVLVVRGRLELHAEAADGAPIVLESITPGQYVGETSLLARAPAAAHVVAAAESELLVLSAADFYEVTGAFPALWADLKETADRRNREHAQRLKA